ncbi:MAG: patatin [Bacteroidetes bacterium]|jgi:NTE family protein|nr:patatin [Bacteroidota bacterium]
MKSAGKRPVIGLALGSGSARGLAHIGVIRALRESDIPVDVVAGTSIGALIGAAYASGRLDTLEEAFRSFDWKRIGSLFDPIFPRSGLISGKKITDFLAAHVCTERLEDLPIPFCAIAADIATGEEIRMRDGDILGAVRASISVPGILTPVLRDGRLLVDGGIVDPVPVSAVRAMGADLVIAVDLNYEIVTGRPLRKQSRRPGVQNAILARLGGSEYTQTAARILERIRARKRPAGARARAKRITHPMPGMGELLLASLHVMQVRLTESRLRVERPEVLIRPPLGPVHLLEFDRAEEVIEIGYRSALHPVRELARSLQR